MGDYATYLQHTPNKDGYFGEYGGAFIPPQLEGPFREIAQAYNRISRSHQFISELRRIRKYYQGRPTPVTHAANLSDKIGTGCQIYLKREDLNHSGAHKLNHCMAEVLLAKHMGKKKVIAETGAGQHGVALATAAAYFGLECEIHMGEVDIAKEAPNVTRMRLLGCRVVPVGAGLRTLKEAVDSAFEAYLQDPENSIYCIGSVVGPHPFPAMVRDFQYIVGSEAREQIVEMTGHRDGLRRRRQQRHRAVRALPRRSSRAGRGRTGRQRDQARRARRHHVLRHRRHHPRLQVLFAADGGGRARARALHRQRPGLPWGRS